MALCYLVSIPWYRSESQDVRVVLGLPDWVAIALGCYVAAALLNALAWLLTDVPDEVAEPGPEPRAPARNGGDA